MEVAQRIAASRMSSVQYLLRTTAVVVGATGAAYGVLSQQGRRARRNIVIPGWRPFLADGMYLPDGTGPHPGSDLSGMIRMAMLGDHDRLVHFLPDVREHLADRVQATPRRADTDELVHVTRPSGRASRPRPAPRSDARTG